MNRHLVIRLLLAAGLCASVAGPVHAEVYKCVDLAGNVTFTDTACQTVSADAQPAAGAGQAEAAAPVITRISLPVSEMPAVARQRQAAAAKRPASQPFALDTATLKAARYVLTERDSAAAQQKLAALR